MQKFFSLVCAVLLVFSASAAPVAQKAQLVKKAPVAVEQMQKVQLEKAQVANFNQLSATPALKVTNQKAQTVRGNQMLKKAQAPARRSAANARKVVNAPQNTAITIGTFSPATYEGEYYVVLTDANSTTQFFFDIDTSVNPFELGKTYTIADMIDGYTGIGDAEDWYAWTIVTDASYTETKDQDGLTHVVASMTDEDGNVYDITYDQPEPQSKTIVASDFSMTDYGTDMFFILTDSDGNQFRFDVLYTGSFEFGKTYTLADMDPDYSWYKLATGGGLTYIEASFTITEDQDGLLHVVAAVVLNNGDSYEITYDEKAFVPTGVQITVDGTDLNGRYMSAYGFYLYTATWGDYTVQLAFDAEEEKAAYTNDDFIADYGLIYSNSEQIQLLKLASDNITITNTETTKTLAGSVYAKNGDEYVLNLVYEKPDAKYIDINVADATLTNKSTIGFWTISGQTADKNNSFNIYFVSKALQGTFTDVEQFDAYSTWVSDKSSGSNVYYENLSEVSLVSVIDGDSLKITGTMNLADANGNPAIVTVYITTPFTQEWGEWADFAPFDFNTGKYTFGTLGDYTQTGVQVLTRKDNTGLKQFNLKNWGKGYFDGVGMDLILNMNPDYTFSFVSDPINLGLDVVFADVATAYNNPAYASYNSYDPETGVFSFYTAVVFADGGSVYTAAEESLVMDRPILERDTVKVNLEAIIVEEDLNSVTGTHRGWLFEGQDTDTLYLVQVLGQEKVGTFSYEDGTLGQNFYNIIPSSGQGRCQFTEGEVTIVDDEEGLKLTGLLIGADEKAYVFNWIQPAGRLQYDTDAPFDATFAWSDMDASIAEGVISISATNAEGRTIGLELYADPAATEIPAGTYTISDTEDDGTALKSAGVVDGYLTECWAGTRAASGGIDDCWFIVEGTITLSYDEYGKLKVVVNGKNSYGQPVTALVQYEKLEPKDVVEVIDAEFAVNEGYVEQYGIMNFYGENAEGYEFDLYAYSDTIAGDFLDVIDFGDCELTLADGTSVGVIDAGEFKVERDGKNLTLIAKVLGSDTVQYNITATGYMGALPYDQTSDFEATFELEKADVQTAAAGTGMTTLTVSNADNQMVALQFYAKADGNKLPARTYPINSTKAKNTVMASQGLTTSGPSYSFAAEIDGEGSITAPWWIVSGEVVVAEDGSITVNALNSLDKTITINIVATFTDLININAAVKATKVVRNGRVMVIKDAKVYSVLGQQIQ
ncbi:MAG: hypothetical protein MJZ79_02060 [Paludibacteraceae bacterium]|nr:hypothetical protein [Paludibacteraceae bacterium]